MCSIKQPFFIGHDLWKSRPTTLNAGLDGSGTLDPFQRSNALPWPGGAFVENFIVANESGTPAETYNIFIRVPGDPTARRVYTLVVTAAVTEFQPIGLFVPPGAELFSTTVAGVDAMVLAVVSRQGLAVGGAVGGAASR